MKINKLAVLSLIPIVIAGCAKQIIIPAELLTQEDSCFEAVARAKIEVAKQTQFRTVQQYKDERNAVMALAITKMAEMGKPQGISEFAPCTLTVQNYLRENGAIARSNNEITMKAISATAIVGGIVATGNALEGLVGVGGATTTVSGSRVISNSGNESVGSAFSSSGTGMGTANTFAERGSASQGGLLPRGNQEAGEGSLDSGSNSGSDEGVVADPSPGTPVEQPVE